MNRRAFVRRLLAGAAAAQLLGVDLFDVRRRALSTETPESRYTASVWVKTPEGEWERKVGPAVEVAPGRFVAFDGTPWQMAFNRQSGGPFVSHAMVRGEAGWPMVEEVRRPVSAYLPALEPTRTSLLSARA